MKWSPPGQRAAQKAVDHGADLVHVLQGQAVVAAEQEVVAHDHVRVGIDGKVPTVDEVPRNVAGEGDPRLNVVLLEKAEKP